MLQTIVTVLLTTIIVAVLTRKSSKNVDVNDAGVFVLKAIKAYLYIGVVILLLGVFFIVFSVMMYLDGEPLGVVVLGSGMGVLFSYGGVYCYMLQKNYKVLYDMEGMQVTNFKNKQTTMKWSEIKSGKFSSISSALKITSSFDSAKSVYIHQHTKGIKQFMKLFIKKTGISLKQTRMPIKLD